MQTDKREPNENHKHRPVMGIFLIGFALIPFAAYLGGRAAEPRISIVNEPGVEIDEVKGAGHQGPSVIANLSTLGGLFGEPVPAALASRAVPQIPLRLPIVALTDPLSDIVFTGSVTVEDKYFALLENRKTHAGTYVAVGDEFRGYQVTAYDGASVTLPVDGSPRVLTLNDNFHLSAAVASAQVSENFAVDETVQTSATDLLRHISLDVNGTVLLSDSTNNAQLKDDVFEGSITLDEYHQRASVSEYSLELSDVRFVNVGSLALETLVEDTPILSIKIRQ